MRRLLAALLAAAIAFAAFGAKAQSVSGSPSTLDAGASLTLSWSGISAPTPGDWIGLYPAGAANGAYVAWRYTDGTAAGSAPLTVPVGTAAGTYELRLFSNNSFTVLATSSSITVTTPPAVTLSGSPSPLDAGAYLSASWSNIVAPLTTDWFGLYPAGAADTGYIAWRYTDGNAAGSLPLLVPIGTPAGAYELRIFTDNSFTRLATSSSITVTAPPAVTLSVSPSTANAGTSVAAAWTNIVTPVTTDWIGLYTVGAADTAFVSFRYTDGNAAGSVSFAIPIGQAAGSYELRIFTNNTFMRLATSNALTITTPPAATLSVTPGSIPPGSTVAAAWTNIVSPAATDWIGLYLPNSVDSAFISWRYTTGTASGSVPFDIAASVAQGTYQLRLFSNNTYTRIATSANFSVSTAKLSFIHADHLNQPRVITDDQQRVVWRLDHGEPFGNNPPDENPSGLGVFEQPLRDEGTYFDKETGLLYNMIRYRDTSGGRFTQADPLGLRGGDPSLYVLRHNNPLSYTDPLGLQRGGGPPPAGSWYNPLPLPNQGPPSASSNLPRESGLIREIGNFPVDNPVTPGEYPGINIPWSMPRGIPNHMPMCGWDCPKSSMACSAGDPTPLVPAFMAPQSGCVWRCRQGPFIGPP